jgi:predicted ATP-binding protein involved in virulence
MSYKDFLKNPVIGILFLSLFAITYLYLDNKSNYKDVISKQENRIIKLEGTVERLQVEVNRRDSLIMVINSRLNNLKND